MQIGVGAASVLLVWLMPLATTNGSFMWIASVTAVVVALLQALAFRIVRKTRRNACEKAIIEVREMAGDGAILPAPTV